MAGMVRHDCDGLRTHSSARPERLLIWTDDNAVASSSSPEVGNSKTMNSVRWLHEHVNVSSGPATVVHPAVDQSLEEAFHQRHSIMLEHCGESLERLLMELPMHGDTASADAFG